ncbi:MAG: hypothetical protein RLZZ342_665 [Candidatus Parcubacteria bacterium]|jgi:hypothetical protein
MMWQDWVIMGVQGGFVLALIPTLRDPAAKPPLFTCVLTTIGLGIMAFCFVTLHMWASVVSLSTMMLMWGVIGYQRYQIDTAAKRARATYCARPCARVS